MDHSLSLLNSSSQLSSFQFEPLELLFAAVLIPPFPRIPHHRPALRAAEGVHSPRETQVLAALEARWVDVAAARQQHEVVGPFSAAFGAGVGHGGGWVGGGGGPPLETVGL
jgi:hypothetical protein